MRAKETGKEFDWGAMRAYRDANLEEVKARVAELITPYASVVVGEMEYPPRIIVQAFKRFEEKGYEEGQRINFNEVEKIKIGDLIAEVCAPFKFRVFRANRREKDTLCYSICVNRDEFVLQEKVP